MIDPEACLHQPLKLLRIDTSLSRGMTQRLGLACSLIHKPDVETDSFALCGHIHPSVTLGGEGRLRERLPCFLLSESRLVLPSFGSFTGTADVVPALQERVFVIAGKSVVEVPIDS